MNNNADFSIGSPAKNILKLAVPMTVAQLINLLYNMIDRIYIGRIPTTGTLALTGLGLCFPIIMIVTAFANLFSFGGAPLFSMERGRENDEEAQKIMGNSFLMMILFGVSLTIIGLLFQKPILYLFGASDVTYPFARDYITIYLTGNIFVMTSLGMNSFINAQGFAKTGMLTVMLGAFTNLILDPIFIFHFGMGVKGAAIATIISQFLSSVWVMKFLTGKKAIIKLTKESMHLRVSRVKRIIDLGMSGFIMSVTNSIVQIICNATLQIYGGDLYVGVMTILNSIREIFTMPVSGITDGATPVMSYNYGAKNFHKLKKAIKFMSIVCIAYTFLAWLTIIEFPDVFIKIFNHDPKLIAKSIPAIEIYFFGFFMMALQFAGQRVFVSLGKSGYAVFFSIFRKVIIVTPLTILLPKFFSLGVKGVFLAEPISNFIGGLACFITMIVVVLPEINNND
ncbi:MATE family efflux transporter [Anaerofustis stercorihominis]|uniref:Multidrug export protein MepA n=1 Tax=Anaerofustis stercorihominis TaxID=214853 RepID=A0A3E3E181_9FIRM|nr:MATE family efflux transporter [Anaerofustis stercorihominis]MCQ4796065.1 MATE family efflux transporter [Anaerofustis stercorihominis]RGD75045.1 MATE family efflux transporter [Anaerofustis stercorihominis]